MNILSDLGKRLINSAVSQVGRDGGKVISNHLYGDAHATPIRNVSLKGNQYVNVTSGEFLTPEDLYAKAIEDGFTPSVCKYKTATKVCWYLIFIFISSVSLIFPFLWLFMHLYLIYRGIKKMLQKEIYMRKTELVTLFKSDARYRTGQKIAGQKEEEIEIKVPITSKEKSSAIKVGLLYILLSIFSMYISIHTNEEMKKDEIKTEQQQ